MIKPNNIRELNIPGLEGVVVVEWRMDIGRMFYYPVPPPGVAKVDAVMLAENVSTFDHARVVASIFRAGYQLAKPPEARHLRFKVPGILHQM